VIPHAFGRSRPVIIREEAQLKLELDLVGSLGDMETATKIISAGIKEKKVLVNPVDEKLASLKLKDISLVDKSSPEFEGITMYAKNTNEAINGQACASDMQVLEAFRIERYVLS
jgi:poly [ADP-ribose] polymerase 2/3/4